MWVLLALVAMHAAAALYHHVVRRDATLRRMLPVE
jgi:cytochrome b561